MWGGVRGVGRVGHWCVIRGHSPDGVETDAVIVQHNVDRGSSPPPHGCGG